MAEDDPAQDTSGELLERLERIERALQTHTQRLRVIERRLRLDAREPAPPPSRRRPSDEHDADGAGAPHASHAPPPDSHAAAPPPDAAAGPPPNATSYQPGTHASAPPPPPRTGAQGQGRAGAGPPGAGAGGAGRGAGASSRAAAPAFGGRRTPALDLEGRIGGNWFNWIGIIAITFGVAFFLKYAFDNQLISPPMRVALGAAAGLGLLAAGEFLRERDFRQYAFVMSGGGILILYLSVYAAHAFYALVGQATAFLLMAAVTALAVALAARFDALPIAVLALIGGFLTPPLLSTGQDNQVGLFTYVALLDAGVLTLAYFKEWRSLNYLSFAGTVLMFCGWMVVHYERAKLGPTVLFLALFFLLYSMLAVVHNVLRRRPARWFDICLVCANASFYYGLSYALLEDGGWGGALGSLALVVSAFYTALYYVAWRWHEEDRLLAYSYLGAAVTFFTVAVAVQLDQHWVTIGWATEALMLTWIGLRARHPAPRRAALVVFAVAVAHWFGWDAPDFAFRDAGVFVPLLNRRALSCAVLVGALAAAVGLYRRAGAGAVEEQERTTAGTLLLLAGNALALALLTLDISDYFGQKLARAAFGDPAYLAQTESARQFALTALWTTYAAAAMWVGVRHGARAVRYGALALLVLATIKALVLDLEYYAAPWHAPFFNLTFAAFVALVAAYWLAVHLYRGAEGVAEDEQTAVPVLVVVANVLALVALSAEASGHFQSGAAAGGVGAGELRDLELARGLALSVVWAVYGGGLLVFGRVRDNRLLRLMALALLGATTMKVFFWDLSLLDRVYRIISFIVLGAILLAVSYLYQKSQRQQRAADAGEV